MKHYSTIRTIAATLAAFALIAGLTESASARDQNFQGGLHFIAGLPQGDFESTVDDNAYGIDGQILWSPQRSPFGLGVSLAFLTFGSETRREPFSNTIPDVTVEVTTSNNLAMGHLLLRAQPKRGDLRPYADGLVGFKYLWMETSIEDDDGGDPIASSTNHDDVALSYGFGGGVMVRIYRGDGDQQKFSVLLDAGARYLLGGKAEYAVRKTIDGTDVEYEIVETETDLLTIQVGVVANF